MSNPKNVVSTRTVEFETFIPKGKSINQGEETLWNKDVNSSYRNPIKNIYKRIKSYMFYILLYFPTLKLY